MDEENIGRNMGSKGANGKNVVTVAVVYIWR